MPFEIEPSKGQIPVDPELTRRKAEQDRVMASLRRVHGFIRTAFSEQDYSLAVYLREYEKKLWDQWDSTKSINSTQTSMLPNESDTSSPDSKPDTIV